MQVCVQSWQHTCLRDYGCHGAIVRLMDRHIHISIPDRARTESGDATRMSRISSLTLRVFPTSIASQFVVHLFQRLWDLIFLRFCFILAPNWHPKSCTNRPKSHAQWAVRFRSVFRWIVNDFWCQVGGHVGPQLAPKIVQNPSQERLETHPNGRSVSDQCFPRIYDECWCQVGTPKPLKMELSLRRRAYFVILPVCLQDASWEPFWECLGEGFGSQNGGFLG